MFALAARFYSFPPSQLGSNTHPNIRFIQASPNPLVKTQALKPGIVKVGAELQTRSQSFFEKNRPFRPGSPPLRIKPIAAFATQTHSDKMTENKVSLTFEEFIKNKVICFEDFNNSHETEALRSELGNKLNIKEAYEDYCQISYNLYLMHLKGGNPATML